MNTTPAFPEQLASQPIRRGRRSGRWHWQAVVAVLLVVIAVEGRPVVATYGASGAATGLAEQAANVARRVANPVSRPAASPSPSASPTAATDDTLMVKANLRPDFQVSFSQVGDGQIGQPLSYTVLIRNTGQSGDTATVSMLVPPELQNVRVSAPGFVCTRRFSASGAEAGTVVTCTRSELDAGAIAEVTITANAPSVAAAYQLTATADPRDEIAEIDEANNEAGATIRVRT